jgi:hypothetical protein
MQFYQPSTSLFEAAGSTPWKIQICLNNMPVLPVMQGPAAAPAYNVVPCPFPSMNTPQHQHSRSAANVYRSNLKAQARIQTQQIDSAIQLLKMQYDAIMASVQKSNLSVERPTPLTSASVTPALVDQKSFSIQFELPAPVFDMESTLTSEIRTTIACKRTIDSLPDEDSLTCVDSESYSLCKSSGSSLQLPLSRTSGSSLQSKKRLRRQ